LDHGNIGVSDLMMSHQSTGILVSHIILFFFKFFGNLAAEMPSDLGNASHMVHVPMGGHNGLEATALGLQGLGQVLQVRGNVRFTRVDEQLAGNVMGESFVVQTYPWRYGMKVLL
jgi:hypothetical protein